MTPEEDETLYPVLVNLHDDRSIGHKLMLTEGTQEYEVSLDYFEVNHDHVDFYRTSYSPLRLKKFGAATKDGRLTVQDRAGIMADTGALTSAAIQRSSTLLSLLEEFDHETNFVVWKTMLSALHALRSSWIFEPQHVRNCIFTAFSIP